MTNLRVADCVYYGMDSFGQKRQSWRITHHLKRVEDTFGQTPAKDEVDEILNGVIARHIEKERESRKARGLPHARRYRFQYCKQEEATHVELVSICGATAPVDECEFIEEVKWPQEMIESHRRNAVAPFWLGRLTDWQWE